MSELINMTDEYETRSGLPVRILCIDAPRDIYPVVALVGSQVHTYTLNGVEDVENIDDAPMNLVKKPKFKVGDEWETRDGQKATILHISDLDEPFKFFGIIQYWDCTLPIAWGENGNAYREFTSRYDLITKLN